MTGKLLSLTEALALQTRVALREQYDLRSKLLGQMVGSLYPSILRDEMSAIGERYAELKADGEEVPPC